MKENYWLDSHSKELDHFAILLQICALPQEEGEQPQQQFIDHQGFHFDFKVGVEGRRGILSSIGQMAGFLDLWGYYL
jgi:hypothetical protein